MCTGEAACAVGMTVKSELGVTQGCLKTFDAQVRHFR